MYNFSTHIGLLKILVYFCFMEQGTYQNSLHDQQRIAVGSITITAIHNNQWIFDTHTKLWYSPEEFQKFYSEAPYQEGVRERFKLMNPTQGLIAADMQIQKILEKKQMLNQRVIEYYQSKTK
jgi:hypothetical protein